MTDKDSPITWQNAERTMLEGHAKTIQQLWEAASTSGFSMSHDFILVKADAEGTRRILLARSTAARTWLQERPETP